MYALSHFCQSPKALPATYRAWNQGNPVQIQPCFKRKKKMGRVTEKTDFTAKTVSKVSGDERNFRCSGGKCLFEFYMNLRQGSD